MAGPSVVALDLAGAAEPWIALGLTVADSVAQVGAVTLRFGMGEEGATGLCGWSLHGTGPPSVDGLRTQWLPAPVRPDHPVDHPLGATAVDHVVVSTPDPRRTFRALEGTGMVLRREAAAGSAEHPLLQGFFRHGETIVEVVGPAQAAGGGPAQLWGITLVVDDLDAARERLGERAGNLRDAVQPGRRILSLRREAGLPVPVALMTPG